MSEEKKIYVPKCSAKQVTFQSGKSILKLGVHAETLCEFLREHANEKGYVNLGISERKQPGQYGDTHCVWLDTWKPQPRGDVPSDKPAGRPRTPAADAAAASTPDSDDNVPF